MKKNKKKSKNRESCARVKRPKVVKLFGYEVEVSWEKSSHYSDAKASGRWYGDYRFIWVDGSKPHGAGQRLVHELVHEISGRMALDLSENQTEALATGFTEFIRLNSEVIKFIEKSG